MFKEKRIPLYDNLKFFLILLVIIGHLAGCDTTQVKIYRSTYLFIYAFHMPLFLFIAGLFHTNKNIISKILSYVTIGFLMKIILFIETSLLNGKISVFRVLEDADIPWYMFVLSIYLLITYLLKNINPYFLFFAAIILACFAGYDDGIGDYLYLSRAFVFYPCYLLGVILEPEKLVKNTRNKYLKFVSVIILGIWGIICLFGIDQAYILRGLFTGRNSFLTSELFTKYGLFYRLLCYGITFLTGGAVICIVPQKEIPFLTKCGSKSLQIYFWHWLLILLVLKTGIGKILVSTREGQIIWLLLGIPVIAVLSFKLFSFPTQNIIKLCKTNIKNVSAE